MDRAYLWAIPAAVIAFVIALFLRDVELRTTSRTPGHELSSVGSPAA